MQVHHTPTPALMSEADEFLPGFKYTIKLKPLVTEAVHGFNSIPFEKRLCTTSRELSLNITDERAYSQSACQIQCRLQKVDFNCSAWYFPNPSNKPICSGKRALKQRYRMQEPKLVTKCKEEETKEDCPARCSYIDYAFTKNEEPMNYEQECKAMLRDIANGRITENFKLPQFHPILNLENIPLNEFLQGDDPYWQCMSFMQRSIIIHFKPTNRRTSVVKLTKRTNFATILSSLGKFVVYEIVS